MSAEDQPETLHDAGCVYVTQAAADSAAAFWRCGFEEARRRLTELALDAQHKGDRADGTEYWRLQSRAAGVDMSLSVSMEGDLAVIVAASFRRRGKKRRR